MEPSEIESSLSSEHEEVRLKAVLELGSSGDPLHLETLRERSRSDPSPLVRYHARKGAEALSARRSSDRLEPASPIPVAEASPPSGYHLVHQKVEQILQAGGEAQRMRLLDALSASRDRRYLILLERIALSDPGRRVRLAAVSASERIERDTAAPEIEAASREEVARRIEGWTLHEDPTVRSAGILAGMAHAHELLVELAPRRILAEEDPWVTTMWLRALGELGRTAHAGLAAELLRRKDPVVRARAASCWLGLDPAEAMPFVTALLDDSDELVRDAAFLAIENHDQEYAVELLEGRVNASHLAPSLRSLQFLSRMDSPLARSVELRILSRESDGRLLERVAASLAEKLPSPELTRLLEVAVRTPAKQDPVVEIARAIQARDAISEELFSTLLREYGLAPPESSGAASVRRMRRRVRKTVQSVAVSVTRGTRAAAAAMTLRNLALFVLFLVAVALGVQTWLVWYPALMATRLLDEANRLYTSASLPAAEEALRSCLAYDPDNAGALERTADVAFDQGDLRGGANALALLKARSRESAAVRRLGARKRLLEGDAEGAMRLAEEARLLAPADPLAHLDLGRASRRAGQSERALQELEAATRLSPGLVAARFELAATLVEAGRREEGARHLQRLLETHPSHADGRFLEARMALHDGENERALRSFRTVLELRPNDTAARLGEGSAYENLKEPRSAKTAYERVLAIDPGNVEALISLARVAQALGEVGDARSALQRVLQADPAHHDGRFALGLLELENGDPASAVDHFKAVVDQAPEAPEGLFNLGLAYLKTGAPSTAAGYFAASAKLEPGQSRAWIGLGYSLHVEGKPGEALAYYETALSIDPRCVEAMVNGAAARMDLGQLDEAEQLLMRALEVSPELGAAKRNLAVLAQEREARSGSAPPSSPVTPTSEGR